MLNNNNSDDLKADEPWWKPGLQMAAQIIGWIAIPIIAALFIGSWLDEKFDSTPFYLLVSVGVAFVITNIGLFINVIKASKKIINQTKDKKES